MLLDYSLREPEINKQKKIKKKTPPVHLLITSANSTEALQTEISSLGHLFIMVFSLMYSFPCLRN